MRDREPTLEERRATALKAKLAQLEKARAKLPANDPLFAEKQAARVATAKARDERDAERKAAKLAKAEADKIAHAEAEKNRREQEEADVKARALQAVEDARRREEEDVEKKKARDARYAARKARAK